MVSRVRFAMTNETVLSVIFDEIKKLDKRKGSLSYELLAYCRVVAECVKRGISPELRAEIAAAVEESLNDFGIFTLGPHTLFGPLISEIKG